VIRRALPLAVAIAFFATAVPATALSIAGLSEQHADGIGDPRLRRELSMTAGRLVVRWDVATADPAKVDGWLAAARSRAIRPLVVFNRTPETRCPSAPCVLPTVAQFTAAFRAFRRRWPAVTEFAPWNEANVRSQPPYDNPHRAAEFYNAMVAQCPSCTVLGAELLDSTDAAEYVRRMAPFIPVEPKAWGIHNYEDINHFRTTGTDAILKVTKSEIWLTEAAGLVRYVDGSGNVLYPYDERFAARAASYLFDYVQSHPDRIARVYYYAWRNRSANDDRFDTALLRRDGSKRPAYDVVASRLAKLLPGIASMRPPSTVARKPQPFALLDRRLRLTRRGLLVGPLRCLPASKPRCDGRLEVRWTGHSKPFGKRRFSLRAGKSSRYVLRVGPRTRRKLARKRSSGKVMLVVALTRPSKVTRTYRRLRIVGNRQRPATRPGGSARG
jgi:hypothetical protein